MVINSLSTSFSRLRVLWERYAEVVGKHVVSLRYRWEVSRPKHGRAGLTFRHRACSILDRHFAALQRTLFIYLINKYISLSDICLTVHH